MARDFLFNIELIQHNKQATVLGSLIGASQALALIEVSQASEMPCLVIVESSEICHQLHQEIEFFKPEDLEVMLFPDWETLPYDHFAAHEDIVSERIQLLSRLKSLKSGIVLVAINTLMYRLAPPSYISGHSLQLAIGDTLDIEQFRQTQQQNGYQHTHSVYAHGEFTVRGSIIDIFPMGSHEPVRIELFDDQIESLRYFDPESQSSTQKIKEIELLPAREHPLNDNSLKLFKQQWFDRFENQSKDQVFYSEICQGIPSPGSEYFLPLFFNETVSLFDYLPAQTQLIIDSNSHASAQRFWAAIKERHHQLEGNKNRPILQPNEIAIEPENIFSIIKQYNRAIFSSELEDKGNTFPLPDISIDRHNERPMSALKAYIEQQNHPVLICADSLGRREMLIDMLAQDGLQPDVVEDWQDFIKSDSNFSITAASIERGTDIKKPALSLITETELFGQHQVLQRRRRQKRQEINPDLMIKNLAELSFGELVVHEHHGIGKYQGLITIEAANQVQEFMMLEYANSAKLYVPVYALQQISRYSSSGLGNEAIALHNLGSEQWSRQREKAQKQIYDTAAELLETYAKREASQGTAMEHSETDYDLFRSAFPFEETLDQSSAIEAVLADMQSDKPMDRLVCGDVGFGKTEVAMRAAFMAVNNQKQVLVLAPTTLLVKQHFENFSDRFSEWPVKIGQLSRFNTAAEQEKTISELEGGSLDIIIGTHKLIQGTIQPKNLGLIIIDEEHRFGVRQKEQLKKYKANTDILTLTATPIPRTLNLAMGGLRDLSIIATAPAKRLAVKTFVTRKDQALVKEAIYRELLRGGQAYYLHNEVKDIESVASEIGELIPEAKIAVAHGQMRERDLENIMSDFYHRRFNILVCTTIIETGIDVPNANTIIINRADKFGLAQLHQLRGRVGRSHHQAYAYLLTPPLKTLTKDAVKRLTAIENAESLGAGFILASQDLEIRGAGAILGEEQSGNHMKHIGYSLYMELLEKSVKALKEGKELTQENLEDENSTELNLGVSALIPDDYLPDVHNRLMLYRRISAANSEKDLEQLQIEMIDRFGLLPEPAKFLFKVSALKIKAKPLNFERIDAHAQGGSITFGNKHNMNTAAFLDLIQKQYGIYKLEKQEKLRFNLDLSDPDSRFQFIDALIETLMPTDAD